MFAFELHDILEKKIHPNGLYYYFSLNSLLEARNHFYNVNYMKITKIKFCKLFRFDAIVVENFLKKIVYKEQ